MASSIPLQLAETLQTAHINRSPSPKHDINPSTAASKKEPVTVSESSQHDFLDDLDDEEEDDEEGIPYSVLRPTKRSAHLPPLPDLRFEQSYLHSIANADTWWKVALITARDQVSRWVLGEEAWKHGANGRGIGHNAAGSRHVIQPSYRRVAGVQQEYPVKWELGRCKSEEVVVECQQLADTRGGGQVEICEVGQLQEWKDREWTLRGLLHDQEMKCHE